VRPLARTPHRAIARTVILVLATGLAVVGIAGAANAWANSISGTVACATSGGWAVTWEVVNSEPNPETITASDRPAAVPVGTTLEASQTRTFTETITTKPAADVALTLSAEWDTGDTSTDSGSIPVAAFTDDCVVTPPPPPTTPTTPPTTPTTPPVVTPPVVAPPEVAPAEVRVVDARARHIDKCGRASDLFKVSKRAGVVYTSRGRTLREGVWLTSPRLALTVRARAAGSTYALEGKRVWRMTFTNRPCARAPEIAPDTGA
jgi:hypothetical protein